MNKPKHISDERLLQLIKEKSIVVNLDDSSLEVNGRAVKAFICGTGGVHESKERYAFGLRIDGKRRTVVRAKLVYMYAHQIVIPENFIIHHRDLDRFNDYYENLIMVPEWDHNKLHHNKIDDGVPF